MIPLKFLTVNLEGIKSNNIAALDLLQTSDISAFQEHWLFEFETPYLHELCDSFDMDYTSRSSSSSSNILFWRQIIIYKLIFTHVHNYNTNDKPPGATTRDIICCLP